jgi:hypothetical protein
MRFVPEITHATYVVGQRLPTSAKALRICAACQSHAVRVWQPGHMSDATAWSAFGVSIVSLGLASVSLGWQRAVFRLTGSVVTVEVSEALVGPGGALLAGSGGMSDLMSQNISGFREPHLAAVVRNKGRIGVSVERVSIKFGPGIIFTHPAYHLNPASGARLEPGASQTWFFPLATISSAVIASMAMKSNLLTEHEARLAHGVVGLGDGSTSISATFTIP